MKIGLITQARLSSSRFKNKILKKTSGITILDLHLKRLIKSNLISKFILATNSDFNNEILNNISKQNNFTFFEYEGDIDDEK